MTRLTCKICGFVSPCSCTPCYHDEEELERYDVHTAHAELGILFEGCRWCPQESFKRSREEKMSDTSLSSEEAIIKAKAEGFEVIVGDQNHLLLDLDTTEQLAQYGAHRHTVWELFGARETARWRSKSGNLHVYLTLDKSASAMVRIALQATLGSDPKREMLAVKRWCNGVEEPSLLFKPREV